MLLFIFLGVLSSQSTQELPFAVAMTAKKRRRAAAILQGGDIALDPEYEIAPFSHRV